MRRTATVTVHGPETRGDLAPPSPPHPVRTAGESLPSAPDSAAISPVAFVERTMAALEGAESGLLLANGPAALACALLALLREGDHLLASAWVQGPTRHFLVDELDAMGVRVTLVNPLETRVWRKRLARATRAILVQSPTDPTGRVLDLRPIRALTRELGLALIVDSTLASPINFRPIAHGADVVIHSATTLLCGRPDASGGVTLGTKPFIEEARRKMHAWGQAPDAGTASRIARGLETLDVRARRANENAVHLARWCANRPEVAVVSHPGIATHPDHEIAASTLDGFGTTFSIVLAGGGDAADAFVRRLRLFTTSTDIGGVHSAISEPRFTSLAHLSADERSALGVPDGFIRLSVGIEAVEDLVADLVGGLAEDL